MTDFWHMDGYGFYIWLSYGLFLTGLSFLILYVLCEARTQAKHLASVETEKKAAHDR